MSANPSPPWHLICKQALKGHSLQTLSRQYNVSVDQIQKHLDRAVDCSTQAGTVRIRSQAEINLASNRARNDLVSILQEAITELKDSHEPRLEQLDKLHCLLVSAAKLYAWPSASIARVSVFNQGPLGYGANGQLDGSTAALEAGPAVNLNLIATSPEQLARLSQQAQE